jgi:HSP20 family protein
LGAARAGENFLLSILDKERLRYYYFATLKGGWRADSRAEGSFGRPANNVFVELRGGNYVMSITRYDPFRDLRMLQDEVNRLFSSNLSRSFGDEGIARGAWAPTVDIYENKDQIVLEAELPGMNREDFELSIENNVLTLRGERRFEKRDESDNYHRVERSYGSFTRSFTLPQTVSPENVAAEYKNGVLRVVLQKREEVKARRIEIAGEGASMPKTIEAKAEESGTAENKGKTATAGK